MLTPKRLALVACAALLSACKLFDETAVQDITDPADAASTRVKFHNFAPSSVGVNFYANNQKVSAVSSTRCSPTPAAADVDACKTTGFELTTGTTYGNGAAGGLYVSLEPGQATLASRIAGTATVVSTLTQTLTAGKFYTFVMSGIYNATTQTAEAFVVEDPIPATIDYSVATIRFVNAIPNGTGDLNLIAVSGATSTNVGAAVAYKAAGAFITVPPGLYDFDVRYTGSATNLFARRTGLALEAGRVYTLTARGSTATASTLALDFTSNQR